ncbi:glycosyltransferase [Flavobacterium branchiophilum]|nr:glycosyltransferase [Flavobacterium branchiophilum]
MITNTFAMPKPKNILVAPLYWGLGHATRCVPIIKALIDHGFSPILASDGKALLLLKKEFPQLLTLELPSYHITYPKKGAFLRWSLLLQAPQIARAVQLENQLVQEWIVTYDLQGIIADSRFGVYSTTIPSVYLTHQLQVLSGFTTFLTRFFHQKIIKQFHECWIFDFENHLNLSGALGHQQNFNFPVKYLGPQSRFEKHICTKKYDVMVLLSGPEPQRTILELELEKKFSFFDGSVIFIRGIVEAKQTYEKIGCIEYYNFMTSTELEWAILSSQLLVCRSGYSTVMDLYQLQKKAVLLPTPGQFEQEYLATYLKKQHLFYSVKQSQFELSDLDRAFEFPEFFPANAVCWESFFEIFTASKT